MRTTISLALLLAALGADASLAAPARHALRYGLQPTTARYRILTTQAREIVAADGVDDSNGSKILQESIQTFAPREDGSLDVRIEARRARARIGEETLKAGDAGSGAVVATYNVTGTGAPATPGADLSPELLPLPIRPVRIGDTWNSTLPPGPGRPFLLRLTHELVEVGEEDGLPVAKIATKARLDQESREQRIRVALDGRAVLDLEHGVLSRSASVIRMEVTYGADPKTGRPAVKVKNRLERKMHRQGFEPPAGSVD